MKKHKRKQPLTLLEIMIVIFLIGLIGGLIGFNMQGSLDKGRAFRSKEGAKRLEEALAYAVNLVDGGTLEDAKTNPDKYLTEVPSVANPKELLKDGWGEKYDLEVINDEIKANSKKLVAYEAKQQAKRDSFSAGHK